MARQEIRGGAPEGDSPRRALYLVWLCIAVSVVAAVAILLLFGLSLWTLLALIFLIACPAVVAWALVVQRGSM